MLNCTDRYNSFFRQLLFLAILIGLGVIIFWQLSFFVGAFLGATTLYIVLRKTLFRMTEQWGWRRWIAAGTLLLIICAAMLGLGYLIFEVIASEIPAVNSALLLKGFEVVQTRINDLFGYTLVPAKLLAESRVFITRLVSMLINTTYSFAANNLMMLVILYFMLVGGRSMEAALYRYAPFSGRSLKLVRREAKQMIFGNAIGIPVVMLAQSVTSALFYWIVGLDNILFWAFLTGIFGLVPMLGTALVTVPLGIYLMATGATWQGIVMLIGAVVVIANVDNLCRIFLMQRTANTHPLVIIFGVVLGIPLFGFWGIIFGPLLISGFLLLIRIYYLEYRLLRNDSMPPSAES